VLVDIAPAAADDHHPLGLRGREDHAGALVAQVRHRQPGHHRRVTRREIPDHRSRAPIAAHLPTRIEDTAVAEEEQVAIPRQEAWRGEVRPAAPPLEDLRHSVDRAVGAAAGHRDDPSVAERDQRRIPTRALHRAHAGPPQRRRAEVERSADAAERPVLARPSGDEEPAALEERLPGANRSRGVRGAVKRRLG
jgi:hypothetical protein